MSSYLTAEDPEFQPIEQLVLSQFGQSPGLHIANFDEMYAYGEAVSGSRVLGLMSYFRAGMQMNAAVRQLIKWHFESLTQPIRLLDFASNCGKSTRFFALEFGPENVWAADSCAEALNFQSSEFHVRTVEAPTQPPNFKPGLQWDSIFVSSFFNRLPEVEFTRWLWKLYSLLTPNGLLIFTAGHPDSPVSLAFVHQSILAVTGSLTHTHIPQGLCFTHDLFIIPKGKFRAEPIRFQYGPNGCVDTCRWTEPNQMKLTGWAYDRTPGESIERIDLYYNNRFRATCSINHDRPDLAAAQTLRSGWDCTADLDGEQIRPSRDWILVKAVSTSGLEFVLRLDHPSHIPEFEFVAGWEYDELLGRSQAVSQVKRFVDFPVNGRFTTSDTTFSGWVACEDADHLEQISLIGRFGNIPYSIVQRPDVYAEYKLHSLGFETTLPPEYLTNSDPQLHFVTRGGTVLTKFETVVDIIAGS